MNDYYKYTTVIEKGQDVWEVKLGPGILPIVINQADLDYWNNVYGTFSLDFRYKDVTFRTFIPAVAAVNKYRAEKSVP
jgi:hypothetical protein